jgi:hypothetical protein
MLKFCFMKIVLQPKFSFMVDEVGFMGYIGKVCTIGWLICKSEDGSG